VIHPKLQVVSWDYLCSPATGPRSYARVDHMGSAHCAASAGLRGETSVSGWSVTR